jgi:hypothetical protein
LSEAFHDGGQMCRIDGLRLSFLTRQDEHGLRDFVPAARWQPSYRFEGLFEKLGQGRSFAVCRPRWKAIADLRASANLLNKINAILPVQTCFQKYIASRFTQISSISIPSCSL